MDEDSSPFHPNDPMTRIQAVKVILGAAGLVSWKDKFELASDVLTQAAKAIHFMDIYPDSPDMWWYSRYIGKACEAAIIDCGEGNSFRPDEPITKAEFDEIISKTLNYSAGLNEKQS